MSHEVTIIREVAVTRHPAWEVRVDGVVGGYILPSYDTENRFDGLWFFITVGGLFPHFSTRRTPTPEKAAKAAARAYVEECIEDGAHFIGKVKRVR